MSGNLYRKDHGAGTAPGYAHKFNEPGIRNVGSYQVAGHPFITGFHFITVPPDQGSVTFDVKCSKFYVSGDIGGGSDTPSYQVMAELTNIATNRMYHLTGSGITKAGALGTEHEP